MFVPDAVFCSLCNLRIYDGEERILMDKGLYHEPCHRVAERAKTRREGLIQLIRTSANHRVTVIPHRAPP